MGNLKAATWDVQTGGVSPAQRLEELVMAWGKDATTGEARYIFELDESRRGARSGCICYSCGKALTAVNAARAQWRIRPHFRHPDGAERNACLVLTARAALLTQLHEQDRIVLPARKVTTQVTGLSGKLYDAWVVRPAERVTIKSFKPRDSVSAVLSLEDGRQVLVRLTGSLKEESSGEVFPVIELSVDDPTLAALDPSTLKTRLQLLVEAGTWCGQHWADIELGKEAQLAAEAAAAQALDWLPSEAEHDLNGAHSQESVLHWLTKEILRQEGRLQVPPVVYREPWVSSKETREIARRRGSLLQLSDVRLERKVGQIRPDVIAQYVDPIDGETGVLLVEVTVTNEIVPERLARIQAEGLAALEINIGQLGGLLTRADFTKLVTEEMAVKKWLFHPWLVQMVAQRKAESEEANRQYVVGLAEARARYLAAFRRLAALRAEDLETPEARQARKEGREEVRKIGEELALYGCEGGDDMELYGWQGCILDRLLSICDGQPVGYRLETLWQVLNTVLSEKAPEKLAWHTLYLSALKAYRHVLAPQHQVRVDAWRSEVRAILEESGARGQRCVYLRNRKFDPLLGLLFPEMRRYLEMPLPGERQTSVSSVAGSAARSPVTHGYASSKPSSGHGWWLTGEDLERWKLQNPDAATAWETFKRV